MKISISAEGSFKRTETFLIRMSRGELFRRLNRFGDEGVQALAAATPRDSGQTANSWTYEIKEDGRSYSIIWNNTYVEDGRPIAILLQYGHGTRTGGYVMGRDYINPALRPIFDRMASALWKEVTSA
jgi:hypothetical protein